MHNNFFLSLIYFVDSDYAIKLWYTIKQILYCLVVIMTIGSFGFQKLKIIIDFYQSFLVEVFYNNVHSYGKLCKVHHGSADFFKFKKINLIMSYVSLSHWFFLCLLCFIFILFINLFFTFFNANGTSSSS